MYSFGQLYYNFHSAYVFLSNQNMVSNTLGRDKHVLEPIGFSKTVLGAWLSPLTRVWLIQQTDLKRIEFQVDRSSTCSQLEGSFVLICFE